MTSRRDQNVSLEDRRAIEKGDDDVVTQHLANGRRLVYRITKHTRSFDHDCILPPGQDVDMNTPRIAPVTNASSEVDELYDKARLRGPDGSPLNIFSTLAHHPALLRRWLVFATHVLAKNSLTPRDR